MKTNIFKLLVLLICIGGFTKLQAQGLYNLATLDEEDGASPLKWTAGVDFTYDDAYESFDEGVGWAKYTVGGGVGLGWSDNDGNSATSYCVSAEFLAKIFGEDQNPNGAGYLGAFANYHSGNSDSFDESLLRAGVKFSYFDRITALNEVQLNYGIKAFYETGSRDFSGFEDDITGIGATAFAGVNFRLCDNVSAGVEVPVVSYLSRTFDSNGSEFKTDSFSAAINKNNPIMATARWHLGNGLKFGGKDTDGDGIWDKDDECPETPGLEAFNGCPDSDNDGIQDNKDGCPNQAGPKSNDGCPDTDGN